MHQFEWKICKPENLYKYEYIPLKNRLKIVDEADHATALFFVYTIIIK